ASGPTVEQGILPGGECRALTWATTSSTPKSGRRDARPLRQARRPPLRCWLRVRCGQRHVCVAEAAGEFLRNISHDDDTEVGLGLNELTKRRSLDHQQDGCVRGDSCGGAGRAIEEGLLSEEFTAVHNRDRRCLLWQHNLHF